ncbi:MAG: NAD(P)/FAD-dependent oxidoreductase [Rhodothermales bacterium]
MDDFLIVGGGLAGAAAALHLSRHHRVRLLEAGGPATGASGAAAGLVNPLMARKAHLAWRADEALDALDELLDLAGATALFRTTGVLRPASDVRQAGFFREAAEAHPQHGVWLEVEAAQERWPDVRLPQGALLVRTGGAIDVAALTEALLAAAQRNGADVQTDVRATGWGETESGAYVDVLREKQSTERLHSDCVLLALGYGYADDSELRRLHLHAVKGQTVRVASPRGIGPLPCVSGRGYVVPEADEWVVGSSYEHDFTDVRPSPEATRRILSKTAQMLPCLENAHVLREVAGVRVGVPGTRLPMVGPLPGRERIWTFTGLGSKGLLMAPLLARALPDFFRDPSAIPAEVRVQQM